MNNARETAFDLLMRVSRSDSYINLLLPSVLRKSQLEESDRGLVQELSYGSLRWQLQYDAIIDLLSSSGSPTERTRTLLRLGLHQLFRMRIPEHAAVSETVELAKRLEPRAAGYVNAILRKAQREGFESLTVQLTQGKSQTEKLAILYSHPQWVVSELKAALELDGRGAELEDLLRSNNETPVVNLAALTATAEEELKGAGLEPGGLVPGAFLVHGNPEPLLSNSVRVQDQGSQLVARVLASLAEKDGRWVDMCAGPGGKAAILQQEIEDPAKLDCYEPAEHRAQLVRDALGDETLANVVTDFGQSIPVDSYQGILLDAPCSGLGSLRRKPESRWRKSREAITELRKTQSELLEAACNGLTKGGVLVYATCSPVLAETNDQIAQLLSGRSDVELIDLVPVVSSLNPEIELNRGRKTIQLWTHRHASDAMFVAALRKK